MLGVTFFLCLSASVVWSETMGDLIWKDGNYYKKSSNIPFNGKVDGDIKGLFKNGKKDGLWEYYSPNGSQYEEHSGIYKNGKKVSSRI